MGAWEHSSGAAPAYPELSAGGFAAGLMAAVRFLFGSFLLCSVSAGTSQNWRCSGGALFQCHQDGAGPIPLELQGLCCE